MLHGYVLRRDRNKLGTKAISSLSTPAPPKKIPLPPLPVGNPHLSGCQEAARLLVVTSEEA